MLIHNLLSWAPWTTTTVCAGKIRHHYSQEQTLQRRSKTIWGWDYVFRIMNTIECLHAFAWTWNQKLHFVLLYYRKVSCNLWQGIWAVVDAPTTPLVKLFLLKKSLLKCCGKKSATSCCRCSEILRWTLNPKDREKEDVPGILCGKKSAASLILWIREKKSLQVLVVARICGLLVILLPREKFVVATDPLLDARYREVLACYRTLNPREKFSGICGKKSAAFMLLILR
jgi:hypothetical protein